MSHQRTKKINLNAESPNYMICKHLIGNFIEIKNKQLTHETSFHVTNKLRFLLLLIVVMHHQK